MPVRMEDGFKMLTHWTKKIIVEEGHSMQQIFHILQLVVRHYKVYYPVRHHLVQHMINSIQRLGFSPTATIEHRRLAVELAEVIIKWELHRIKVMTYFIKLIQIYVSRYNFVNIKLILLLFTFRMKQKVQKMVEYQVA